VARIREIPQEELWLIGGQGFICPVAQFRIQADKRKTAKKYEQE
jgi:hypothetical protein